MGAVFPNRGTEKPRKEKNVNRIRKIFFLNRESENISDIWSHNTLKSISLPLIFTVSSQC